MDYLNVAKFYKRAKSLFGTEKQESIVRNTGISQGTISRIQLEKGIPRIDTIVKIAMYYKVNVNWLIGIEGAARDVSEETPNTDAECEAYGLSDQAIRALRELKGTKIAKGIDYLLSSYCFAEDRGKSKTLLEAIANYCVDATVTWNDKEDVICCFDEDGTFTVEGKQVSTPLCYGERVLSLSDVILEAQIQDIYQVLRSMKERKMRMKKWNVKG